MAEDNEREHISRALVLSKEELSALERILGVVFPDEFDIQLTFREAQQPGRTVRVARRADVAVRQFGEVIRDVQGSVADREMPA